MIRHLSSSTARGYLPSGPFGRMARLGLLAIFGGTLYSIVDASGSARFRNPHILTEPSAWLLHVTMLLVFLVLVGTIASALVGARQVIRIQIATTLVLAGGVGVAASVGGLVYGSIWGFPLADLVWWFDVAMLAVGLTTTALAIVLGTPGCEIGVLGELIAYFRGTRGNVPDTSRCIVGLHLLDAWERRATKRIRDPLT